VTTTPGQLFPAAKIVTSTRDLDRDIYRAIHITLNSSYQRRSEH
jgi:hypothetical protein